MLNAEKLVELEQHFGGRHRMKRVHVSPHQPGVAHPCMQGGDRMGKPHRYAARYAKALTPFHQRSDLVIMEIGILRGTGLAIWSKVFPDADLIGLDITLQNFDRDGLKAKGAFEHKTPELHTLDQFTVTADDIARILAGRKTHIVMDDGCHHASAIRRTFRAIEPYLADSFAYFIEDVPSVSLGQLPLGSVCSYASQLTVIERP
jgi:hypothetical protein